MIGTAIGYVLIVCAACYACILYFVSRLRKGPWFSTVGAERYLVRLNLDLAVGSFCFLGGRQGSVACILFSTVVVVKDRGVPHRSPFFFSC